MNKKLLYLLSLFNLSTLIPQEQPSDKLRLITQSAALITTFSATCMANHLSIHNIGHALVLKYLVKNRKNLSFSDIVTGATNYPKNSLSRNEEILFFMAGPALELGINYAYFKLVERFANRHPSFKGCKYGAVAGMAEAIISLIPFKLCVPNLTHCIKSDGYYILKNVAPEQWFLRKYLRSFK